MSFCANVAYPALGSIDEFLKMLQSMQDSRGLSNERQHRICRFSLPPGMEISNLSGLEKDKEAKGGSSSHIVRVFQEQVDASLTWEFVKWMRDVTKLPIFVKVHSGAAAMMGSYSSVVGS